jgi:hypothetical protein
MGVQQGLCHCEDPVAAAKMIQTLITGGMISWVSEGLPMGKENYKNWLIETCLRIAGFPVPSKV